MSSKTQKQANGHGNGTAKRGANTAARYTQRADSKAAALTERAWKKTYENRGKSKDSA
jgi:hypothetical protein